MSPHVNLCDVYGHRTQAVARLHAEADLANLVEQSTCDVGLAGPILSDRHADAAPCVVALSWLQAQVVLMLLLLLLVVWWTKCRRWW